MAKKSAPRKARKYSRSGKARAHAEKLETTSTPHAARKPSRGEKPGKAGSSWKEIPGKGFVDGIQPKKGCFPKLLMLVLPMFAIGANILLGS